MDRANLTVHSIDPQGLISVGPQTRASTPNIEELPNRPPAQIVRLEAQRNEMNNVLKGQQVVRVNVDAAAFARSATGDVPLDVAIVATDRTGQPVGSARQQSTIPSGFAGTASAGANVSSHLQLPPGDYGIRVAIADGATGRRFVVE